MSNIPNQLRNLLMQALRFVGLSGIGWLLDFAVYTILSTCVSNLAAANMISSLVGASFVFIFSTRFVFQNSHRIPLIWKYCVYIAYQALLILLISLLLAQINTLITTHVSVGIIVRASAILSKIIVTPITMTLNFFIMKFVIEKIYNQSLRWQRFPEGLVYLMSACLRKECPFFCGIKNSQSLMICNANAFVLSC